MAYQPNALSAAGFFCKSKFRYCRRVRSRISNIFVSLFNTVKINWPVLQIFECEIILLIHSSSFPVPKTEKGEFNLLFVLQTFKNYVALTSCFITDPHHQDSIIIHGNRVFWFDPHFVIFHGGLYVTLQTLWSPEKHTGNMLLKVSNTCDSIGFIYLLYDREGNNHSYDNVLPNIYQISLGFFVG